MVNFVAVFADALWIVGLAGILATLGFAEAERRPVFADRPQPAARRLLFPMALSLALVGVGLLLGAWRGDAPWAGWRLAAAAVSSALSIILVLSAWRRPRRAARNPSPQGG